MLNTASVRRAGWVLMTVLATLVALGSARYFTLDHQVFLSAQEAVYAANLGVLLLHVGGGVVSLAVGPWQLWTGLRARRPRLHRALGRIYVAAAAAAGVGGVLLAPRSLGGPVAHLGFIALGVAGLVTTTVAVLAIRRRQVQRHRAWMIRSYTLIFTAVTFRLWLAVAGVAGLPFLPMYAAGSWATWVLGLAVVEVALRAGRRRRPSRAAEGLTFGAGSGPLALEQLGGRGR